jgi:C4-dicarboxylate-specific signal transduction histidine kinase
MIYQSAALLNLGEMSTGLAHELAQPLNTIGLAVGNLIAEIEAGEATPDGLRRRTRRIDASIERARTIIDHMRMFSRGGAGAVEPVDLAAAVDGALLMMEAQLRGAGIAIRRHDATGGVTVAAERRLIEQVLINLLVNARDAILGAGADGAGGEMWIDISVGESADGMAVLRVADSGPGVPAEARARLFEPFFTTKPVGKGTGLGLSLSFGIIRDLGGSIRLAESARGACFEIRLPIAAPVAAPVADVAPPRSRGAA